MNDLDSILNDATQLTEDNKRRLTSWQSTGEKDIYCLVTSGNTPFYVGASAAIGQKMSAHRKEFADLSQLNALLLEVQPEDWRVAKIKWSKRLLGAGCGLLNQDARALCQPDSGDRAGIQISRHNFNRLTEESIKQSKPRGAILDDLLERYFSPQET